MARYTGPRARVSRRLGTNIFGTKGEIVALDKSTGVPDVAATRLSTCFNSRRSRRPVSPTVCPRSSFAVSTRRPTAARV